MTDSQWSTLIADLIEGRDLSAEQTHWAMGRVMDGEVDEVQLAGFLVALASKGETVAELRGIADAMLERAVSIEVPGATVDIVGTGGDRHRTVNISTMAALVVAGAGIQVVKHGNRASTSASGSADVLAELGVNLELAPDRVAAITTRASITFLFAQVFHPAFRHAAPARRRLGVPTALNALGPLTNPARPDFSAIGVGNSRMAPLVAGVLGERGSTALVFQSADGLDELSTTAPASLWAVSSGQIDRHEIDFVTALGLPPATLDDIRGGTPAQNAEIFRRVLAGERGPVRDVVLLNAAAAMVGAVVAESPSTAKLVSALAAAFQRGASVIDSGQAQEALDTWILATNQ